MVKLVTATWPHAEPFPPEIPITPHTPTRRATRACAIIAWTYALWVSAILSTLAPPITLPSFLVAPVFGMAALWVGQVRRHVTRQSPWFVINVVAFAFACPPAAYLAGFRGAQLLGYAVAIFLVAWTTSFLWRAWLRPTPEPALISLAKGIVTALLSASVAYAVAWAPLAGTSVGTFSEVWSWIMRVGVSTFVVSTLGHFLLELPSARQHLTLRDGLVIACTIGFPVPTILLALPEYTGIYLLLAGAVIAATMLHPRLAIVAISGTVLVATIMAEFRLGPFGRGYSTVDVATTLLVFCLITTYVASSLVADRMEREAMYTRLAAQHDEHVTQVELLNLVFESIADGVAVFDTDGSLILRNSAAARMMGTYPAVQVSHPGRRRGSATERVLRGCEDTVVTDVEVPVPGDEPRTVNVTAHAMVVGPRRAVTILKDVTTERRHVEELRRFARVVAHDLRSPLTALSLWTQTAADELECGDVRTAQDSLGRMVGTIERMESLIADLLQYSVSAEPSCQVAPVDVRALVEASLATQVGEASGVRAVNLVPPGVEMMVDATQFSRVIDNLVSNAVKYTPAGRTAEVTVAFVQTSARWGRLLVSDRGVGIPEGQERQVFDEMYRVPEHAELAGGTGLGLAICRRIVVQHGGTIKALRREGGGTTFELVVPLTGHPGGRSAEGRGAEERPAGARAEPHRRTSVRAAGSARVSHR